MKFAPHLLWLAIAALATACRAPAPEPVQHVALPTFASALRAVAETTAIDFGTPAARAHLHEGWGTAERSGSLTFSWGAGPLSRLSFELVAARDLELRLRGWSFPFAGGESQRVEVRVNGRTIGAQEIAAEATTLRFALPAAALRNGENLLEMRYGRWNDRPGEAPWAVAWDGLRLAAADRGATDPSPARVEIDAAAGAITLPSGTGVEGTLELPPGTRLAWGSIEQNGSARLELSAEDEAGRIVERRVRSTAAGGFDLTAASSAPALVRFALRAPGTNGAVRVQGLHLEQPLPPAAENGAAEPPTAKLAVAPAAPAPRPNLIVYMIDTLRADHLGCYGYPRPTSPRIDRFAAASILFENGRAQSSWTKPAVASILTGLFPVAHGAELRSQRLHESVETLAERLQSLGYETALFTSNANITARFGFDQGWTTFRYLAHRRGRKHEHFDAAEMNREVFAWLAEREQRAGAPPFFLVIHTLDPHDPYRPREEFRSRLAPEVDVEAACCLHTPELAALSEVAARQHALAAMALYDAEIAQNDAAFGDLLDELDRRGLAATSALLLTADHGEEFFDHGGWKHGFTLYEELLRIPFVLRLPEAPERIPGGRRVAAAVDQIDIAPTLLALAGAPAAPELPGRDVRGLADSARASDLEPHTSFAWLARPGSVITSVVAAPWKLIRFAGESRVAPGEPSSGFWSALALPDRELYDLARDPLERATRLDLERPRSLRELWLEGRLSRALAHHGGSAPAEEAEIDPELEQSLRALGYF